MAARYSVTAMLKGNVKTGRSHLLRMVLRALERMGLRAESAEILVGRQAQDGTALGDPAPSLLPPPLPPD